MASVTGLVLATLLLPCTLSAPSASAGGTAPGADSLQDSVDFLEEHPAQSRAGARRSLRDGNGVVDPSWAIPKHSRTATARLLASITASADPGDGGAPTSTLSQACRVELAIMFQDPALCDASAVGQLCTDVMEELLAWRVVCIAGVFASRTASLFLPTTKGARKAQWGSKGYVGQLGSVKKSKAPVLGPVLAAIVENPGPARTLILFNWVSEMARLVYKNAKMSPDTPSLITLGRAALERLDHSVTVVPPKVANATSPGGRAGTQSKPQFTTLAFVDNVLIGSGYTDTLEPIWPPQLWYRGSLQIFDYPTGSATSVFKESSSTSEIGDSLSVAGSAEYNGAFGLKASASASYMTSRLSSSTAYLATLAKRTYQVPDAVLGTLQLSDLPQLNDQAAADLNNKGEQYFADKYGVYFVHSVLYKAYADAWAQAYTSSTSNAQAVAASVSGSFGGFSGSMETNWQANQKNSDFQYTVITSSSFPCASRDFEKLETCSNDAIQDKTPGLGYKLILMRLSDLPDYQRIISNPTLPTQSPYDLLGDALKGEISKLWARGQYFLLTVGKITTSQFVQGGIDCGPKCFQKNVVRILQVLSDLTANKDLGADGTKIFLAESPTSKPKMRIIKRRIEPFTMDYGNTILKSKVQWARVGPGVLVTLFQSQAKLDSGQEDDAFHMGEGTTTVRAFQSQYFAGQGSVAKVEYIAAMDIDRKSDLVDIMRKQLNDLESDAKWSTGCRTPPPTGTSCASNQFLQGFQLVGQQVLTCCTMPELGLKAMTFGEQISTSEVDFSGTKAGQLAVNCNGTKGGAIKELALYSGDIKFFFGLELKFLLGKYSCWSLAGLNNTKTLTGCREVQGPFTQEGALTCSLKERMTDIVIRNLVAGRVFVATCCKLPE